MEAPIPKARSRYGMRYALKYYKYYMLSTLMWISLMIALFIIRGKKFKTGSGLTSLKGGLFPLHQADVSFMIGTGEYICESLYSLWYAIMAWRIVYILLQTRGTSLLEIANLTGGWMPSFGVIGYRNHFYSSTSVAVMGIIFLGIPAKYAAGPLLSGAMSWNPAKVDGPPVYIQGFPVAANTQAYTNFATSEAMQRDAIIKCAGMAVRAAPLQNVMLDSWRPLVNMSVAVDSKIQNVAAPLFTLDKSTITFVEPSDRLIQYMTVSKSTNGSDPDDDAADTVSGVLRYDVVGGISILQKIDFNITEFPTAIQPTHHEYDIGLMTDLIFVDAPGETRTNCSTDSKYFSDLPTNMIYEKRWPIENTTMVSCFVQAHVKMQIGKSEHMDGIVPSHGLANLEKNTYKVDGDPLTPMVLYLLSDVMSITALTNQTGIQTWNRTEDYIAEFMRLSYYATWNTINIVFQDPDKVPDNTTVCVIAQEDRIMLQLETIFTALWVVAIGVAILAGLAFTVMANFMYTRHGVIVSDIQDPVHAALRLDLTPALDDISSLSTRSKSSKEHERVRLVFKHVNDNKPIEQNGEKVENWYMLRQIEKGAQGKEDQDSSHF